MALFHHRDVIYLFSYAGGVKGCERRGFLGVFNGRYNADHFLKDGAYRLINKTAHVSLGNMTFI